jgi:PPOX class probable F420-dependent enzyme
MSLEDLPGYARELLVEGRVAHLGLLDMEDRPRVLPVTFALAGGALWSVVDEKRKRAADRELARVRWLRRRPEAALTVDLYDDDWSRLAWVQVLGRVEIVEVTDGSEGLEALAAKYAPYREREPPGPLLRLVPERALHWSAAGDD